MASFADSAGRVWTLDITAWHLKQVRVATGVDLGKLLGDEMRPLVEFVSDTVRFIDVLYVLCKDQAEKLNVTDEEFGRSLGGDAIEDAGKAFEEAFLFFCPSRTRKVLAAARDKAEAAQDLAAARAMKILGDLDPATIFSASASNSPASAGLNPGG